MAISARFVVVIGAILFAVFAVAFLQAVAVGQERESWLSGEPVEAEDGKVFAAERLIVTYDPGAPESAEDEAVRKVAGEVRRDIEPAGAEVVGVPSAEQASPGRERRDALRRAREELEDEPGVAGVEYDFVRRSSYVPSDPSFPDQWGLRKAGFPRSWGSTAGNDGEGAEIAVVDSGIDAGHPDLGGKVVAQRDFVGDDGVAGDDTGHGTHVAGIAAARTGNGAGVSGGCPDCGLVVAKTMRGGVGYDSDIAAAIIWAADNGAEVINLSLNGPEPSGTLKRAMDHAWGRGALVVAAAGNAGNGVVQYPAAYSTAIAVAASTPFDRRAPFSSYGGWVDVSAPGVGVLSTVPGGGYAAREGTSMASPHVAALAGLLMSRGLTNGQAKARILSAAADVGPAGRDPYHGSGRINAVRALWPPTSQPQPAQPASPQEDRANDANVGSNPDARRREATDDRQTAPRNTGQAPPAEQATPPASEPAVEARPASTRAAEDAGATRDPSPQPQAEEDAGREDRRISFAEDHSVLVAPAPDIPDQAARPEGEDPAPTTQAAASPYTTLGYRALVGAPALLLLALLLAAYRLLRTAGKPPPADGTAECRATNRPRRHRKVRSR